MFHERLAKLNPEQRQAVDTIEGPVLVVAGPGSGKTELLSLRVANILKETDVLPGNILSLTFTEAAARNMQERLAGLIGDDGYKVAINTFHGFGRDIINEWREYFYQGVEVEVADDVTKLALLEELFTNLPLKHPLRSFHSERGFVYMGDVQQRIGELKKGGLTAEEFGKILDANETFLQGVAPIVSEFFNRRLSKSVLGEVPQLVEAIGALPGDEPLDGFVSLKEVYLQQLLPVLQAEETTPLTAWKKTFLEKDEDGVQVPKDLRRLTKLRGLQEMYGAYQELMHARGFVDFDDMLLDTARTIETRTDLQANLQERYQYILVDEFQDTSGVQMRLLRTLLNMEITNNRPNVMAVGDDDQAIYKFQGANLGNILGFHKTFDDPVFITLVNNYRSTQSILDLSREVIVQGEERLEHHVEEMSKELVASHPERQEGGSITYHAYPTIADEMMAVCAQLKEVQAAGEALADIAIISPKHRELMQLAQLLESQGIPVSYDKKNNILEDPLIVQLLTLLRFVASLAQEGGTEEQTLLPEILSFPCWKLDPMALWRLSRQAYDEQKPWLEMMVAHEDTTLKELAELLVIWGLEAKTATVEHMLDLLLGTAALGEGEEEKRSPLYDTYFSAEARTAEPRRYIRFLSHLQRLYRAFQEHGKGRVLTVEEALQYLDTLATNHLGIMDTSPFQSGPDAVHLLTAHGSKGLEFQRVFVLCAQDNYWLGKGRPTLLKLPANVPLMPEGDGRDDKLRLFYVALTRAKEHLVITSHTQDLTGKELRGLQFLAQEPEVVTHEGELWERHTTEVLEHWLHMTDGTRQLADQEKELLAPLLERYAMSITHLNTFVDFVYEGPEKFLEKHLLQFPKSKTAQSSFGTAMHRAVQLWYRDSKEAGKVQDLSNLQTHFVTALDRERLAPGELAEWKAYGLERLEVYHKEQAGKIDINDLLERNFREQHIVVGGVPITGQIDRLHVDQENKTVQVTDFKTGKPVHSWTAGKDKLKLWKYKNQLIFYKLLIEHSSIYEGYTVQEGSLEFLEHDEKERIIALPLEVTREDMEELIALLRGVYHCIKNYEFPDTSKYSQDYKGVMEFVEELKRR